MTAKLPDTHFELNTLAQMPVGGSGYTVPWAMAVFSGSNDCYLNGSYTFHEQPGGTVRMHVERRRDGYYVKLVRDHKYQPVDRIPWVGAADNNLIPVQAFL